MHKPKPENETCRITEALDRNRIVKGLLYAVSGNGLLLETTSLTLLGKCESCPLGVRRELSASNGIAEIKCLKWGTLSEV